MLFHHWVLLDSFCNPMKCSPFHTVHGILKARILKWFAIPFSSGPHFDWRREEKGTTEDEMVRWHLIQWTQWTWVWVNSGSCWWIGRPGVLQSMGLQSLTRLSDWTELNWSVACQTPLSMGFPRQEYWSGFLFPPLGDLPNPGTESTSPSFVGRLFFFFYIYTEPLGKPQGYGIP